MAPSPGGGIWSLRAYGPTPKKPVLLTVSEPEDSLLHRPAGPLAARQREILASCILSEPISLALPQIPTQPPSLIDPVHRSFHYPSSLACLTLSLCSSLRHPHRQRLRQQGWSTYLSAWVVSPATRRHSLNTISNPIIGQALALRGLSPVSSLPGTKPQYGQGPGLSHSLFGHGSQQHARIMQRLKTEMKRVTRVTVPSAPADSMMVEAWHLVLSAPNGLALPFAQPFSRLSSLASKMPRHREPNRKEGRGCLLAGLSRGRLPPSRNLQHGQLRGTVEASRPVAQRPRATFQARAKGQRRGLLGPIRKNLPHGDRRRAVAASLGVRYPRAGAGQPGLCSRAVRPVGLGARLCGFLREDEKAAACPLRRSSGDRVQQGRGVVLGPQGGLFASHG